METDDDSCAPDDVRSRPANGWLTGDTTMKWDSYSDPVELPDGSISQLIHYPDGTMIWHKWHPTSGLNITKVVDPDPAGHMTLPDGSIFSTYTLPDGTHAVAAGAEGGGTGVDWIQLRPKGVRIEFN
jgi:hypothetical protein